MADLSAKKSSGLTRIIGDEEANVTEVSSEGRLFVQQPASSTGTHSQVSVTSTSTQLLASNSNRKFAYIINNSGSTMWVKFGVSAVANEGFAILSGSIMTICADVLWTGVINGIKQGGGSITIDLFEAT